MTSPACTAIASFRTVSVPSCATCSTRTSPASAIVTDRSVSRKSPAVIVETCERESPAKAPIECGCLRT